VEKFVHISKGTIEIQVVIMFGYSGVKPCRRVPLLVWLEFLLDELMK